MPDRGFMTGTEYDAMLIAMGREMVRARQQELSDELRNNFEVQARVRANQAAALAQHYAEKAAEMRAQGFSDAQVPSALGATDRYFSWLL